MKRYKQLLAAVLALVTVFSLSACGGSKDSETPSGDDSQEDLQTITFVLDWTPNTNHTGLYVALAKGYFADAGLDVEVVQPPEDGAEVLVGSGKAQFGVSFQDTMAPALIGDDPLPITAVAAIIQHNTSGIISRKGEGMDHPAGLENHKYATWDLPVEKATIQQVMEADGGDFSKVELIPSTVTDEVSALQSKSVDAIWIFYAWAGIACEVAGLETDYFAFADIDPVFDFYTPVVIANNDFLAEHPDTAKAFLAALSQGYQDAIDNPQEAADILMEAAPELQDSSDLVYASQEYLAEQYAADAAQWGVFDAQRWGAFYTWLNDKQLLDAPWTPKRASATTSCPLPEMEKLEVRHVSKAFDGRSVLEDVSLTLREGELVCLLGVSGGGKSTLFNIISGLLQPDAGQVFLDGEEVTGRPGKISYMLQKDLLLPYRTIVDNVALPLLLRGVSKKEARQQASALFEEFGLEGTQTLWPSQLSGGMRQRAALLRTYLFSQNVALLDEPFSALDTLTKSAVHEWYLAVMERIRLSTLFITHDIDEAILLSDRIYLLTGQPGRICDEIRITQPKPRPHDFNLTPEFLAY